MNLFDENLERLRSHDPVLAQRVSAADIPETVQVLPAKDGCPVPRIGNISLHSTYRPKEEAARAVSEFNAQPGLDSVIYGLGFGYHVTAMLEKFPGQVTVIEPSMGIFKAFLSAIDLQPFLLRTRFWIEQPTPKLVARRNPEMWKIFRHIPSVRVSQAYFENLERDLELTGFLNRRSLKILVVNPIYGGSLPTARHCTGALKNLGHQVAVAECDKFADGFDSLKDITGNPENANALSQLFMNLMGETVAARAAEFQPDLILALAQAPLSPQAIERLKSLKVPVAFWFVEDFRTLPYWKEIASSYDYFFTIQQGEILERLQSEGAKNVYYLPQGCFPDVHRPLKLNPNDKKIYGADLAGNASKPIRMKSPYRQCLISD